MHVEPVVRRESDTPTERWTDPVRGDLGFRTLFGDGSVPTDSLTAGVAQLELGGWLGHHRHDPAEVYYVIEGTGVVHVGGQERAVEAGTAVFIPSDVEHGIRNTGRSPLRLFFAFAVDSMDGIEYRFRAASVGHDPPDED